MPAVKLLRHLPPAFLQSVDPGLQESSRLHPDVQEVYVKVT
jgi:hypothetical protein